MSDNQIVVANAPDIQDLNFRHFRGESDYGSMAAVITASSKEDNFDRQVTTEDIVVAFSNDPSNCDPYKDMIFAEIAGEVVGYTRGWWTEEPPLLRLYKHNGFLVPEWRRKGIGLTTLKWMENRLKDISETHPPELEKYLQVNVSRFQEGAAVMLEQAEYQPIRYFYQMVRPNLDDIPDFPLPEGLEIRSATSDHYQKIWESMHETPQDEWGSTEPTEESYREWVTHHHFQPHLWQIAWDQVSNNPVGHVLTFIDHEENKQFNRMRGYTEGIGVSRKWRQRGVARALISLSLQAQKGEGMNESALVADTESTSGVTRLFESCGFEIVDQDTIYRKPL